MNKLKGYNQFIEKYNTVGTSVAYLNKNNELETICTGYSDLTTLKPTNENNIYRIASISKVIVAIGVLQLYDQGKVDLDEDISVYLGYKIRNPKYIDEKITLRMVMTQTSSITDNGSRESGEITGYDGSNSTDDYIPLHDLLTPNSKYYCKDTYSNYKPGENFEYSNLGCGILACIIEKVTNIYFPTYIKEKLLLPLGIKSGFRLEDLAYKENLASHYLYENSKFILYRNYELFKKVQCLIYPLGDNYRGVAGGLYITSVDLSKIMGMLMNKGIYNNIRILKDSTIEEMEKVQWEGIPLDPTYRKKGLQMIIMDQFTKKPLHGHFGNAYGLRSFMLYNENGGIIFLCNGADFISDEEHMTILQEDVIKYLVKQVEL